MQKRRIARALVTAAAGLCAAAPGAFAAQVSKSDAGIITFQAAAGEDNSVTLTDDALNNQFTDQAGVTPGPGCIDDPAADPTVALCPRPGTSVIVFDLGDLDDDVTVTDLDAIGLLERGGPGADILRGSNGTATSTLIGGEGTDSYEMPARPSTR